MVDGPRLESRPLCLIGCLITVSVECARAWAFLVDFSSRVKVELGLEDEDFRPARNSSQSQLENKDFRWEHLGVQFSIDVFVASCAIFRSLSRKRVHPSLLQRDNLSPNSADLSSRRATQSFCRLMIHPDALRNNTTTNHILLSRRCSGRTASQWPRPRMTPPRATTQEKKRLKTRNERTGETSR